MLRLFQRHDFALPSTGAKTIIDFRNLVVKPFPNRRIANLVPADAIQQLFRDCRQAFPQLAHPSNFLGPRDNALSGAPPGPGFRRPGMADAIAVPANCQRGRTDDRLVDDNFTFGSHDGARSIARGRRSEGQERRQAA